MAEHPDWAAVGSEVAMVRTLGSGRTDHQRNGIVTRHTPTQVIVDGEYRFKRFERYGKVRYVEVPRYMHTTTTIEPISSEGGAPSPTTSPEAEPPSDDPLTQAVRDGSFKPGDSYL